MIQGCPTPEGGGSGANWKALLSLPPYEKKLFDVSNLQHKEIVMKEKFFEFVKAHPIPVIMLIAVGLIILGSVLTKFSFGI